MFLPHPSGYFFSPSNYTSLRIRVGKFMNGSRTAFCYIKSKINQLSRSGYRKFIATKKMRFPASQCDTPHSCLDFPVIGFRYREAILGTGNFQVWLSLTYPCTGRFTVPKPKLIESNGIFAIVFSNEMAGMWEFYRLRDIER